MAIEKELVDLMKKYYENVDHCIGYPVCQYPNISGFGEWYDKTGLCDISINNVGNPFDAEQFVLNSTMIERDVIRKFSRIYGVPEGKEWGFVTNSGTDGNMHGIYFGAKKLQKETGMLPLVYISKEAHYSSSRICDVQNLETRMIDYDKYGRMDPEAFREALDPTRPALIVFAIGSTFMGAVDDIQAIQKVLDEKKPVGVYKHLDAALFGGYLPFTPYKDLVNMQKQGYDSIAISGHKFFGVDEPCGLFISRQEIIDSQQSFKVEYLRNDMPLISCSRNGLTPLKFHWIMNAMGNEGFEKEAAFMLENTQYLQDKLDENNYPAWHLKYSNTVFFKRPPQWIRDKYMLANGYMEEYGGELSHVVVMQHVTKDIIDEFIEDILSSVEE
ncbi:MAG: aminotransferase class V-fold PLP-dependent enzyme [Clostridia bacterium]|nr:aminotransferase class V-fold PLP-dependent enzyme [Clostridia bacterium]